MPITEFVPSDGTVRPKGGNTKYALPGDKHIAEYQLLAIDVDTRAIANAQYPPVPDAVLWAGLFSGNRAWWSDDSCTAYFIDMARGQQKASVVAFNTQTEAAQVLFHESSKTHIDLNFDFECPAIQRCIGKTNELIWFSERSGWAHLYLYDLNTGELKHSITQGDWVVREILHIDPETREILIQTAGRVSKRDPYYRDICRVNIDTGELITLISGDHDYVVHVQNTIAVSGAKYFKFASDDCAGIPASGNYIVTTRTRVDEVPSTQLIDCEGRSVMAIETADIAGLPDGWNWPEPIELLSADKNTHTFGIVFRPSDFSPEKQYPVVNWVHSNPFYAEVPKGAFRTSMLGGYVYMSAAAYAELGFIVVIIDGRGSCYRSKAFRDEAYGRIHTGSNLEDQISGIKQLAKRYPYMDLDRVGIVDAAGSNAPIYGLLAYPDFYCVGAVSSVWDVRLLTQGEIFQGLAPDTDYAQSVLGNMASSLQGKLLLIHGLMDPYYHASGFLQLVDALVKENKDFDLVVLPSGGHTPDSSHYGIRKIWDYLVIHLQGNKPPLEFRLSSGLEFALSKG